MLMPGTEQTPGGFVGASLLVYGTVRWELGCNCTFVYRTLLVCCELGLDLGPSNSSLPYPWLHCLPTAEF